MTKNHTLIIGSGINSLVCAALLAKAGKKVLILERSATIGGCIQSKTVEGCVIDTLSTAYPLFVTSPVFGLLKDDLAAEGIEFVHNDVPTGAIMSDRSFAIIKTNREENIKNFNALSDGDGDRFSAEMNWVGSHAELLFTILGSELVTLKTAKFLAKYVWKNGIINSLKNVQGFMPSVRNNLPNSFNSKPLLAAMAPWVLHTGLTPESPFSATMSKIVSMTVEMVGLPMIKGGSFKIVEALKNIIEKNNGEFITNTHVSEILINGKGQAEGIKTEKGETFFAQNIVANVTPTQLYGSLIKNEQYIPEKVKIEAKNYKYGKGNMQIHLILNEKPNWKEKQLENVTYVHLTDGINDVSAAVNEATQLIIPKKPTICIAQPTALDPSRAAEGKHILWIQLPECPNFPKADALGLLNNECKGEWTNTLKEAYADRIIETISEYISNIKSACCYREVISPKELSEMNINLVNGDPYSGSCEIDQYLLWRPLASLKNHETTVRNLYQIGASTHPGPGLGAGSGFLVAQKLK